MSYYNEDNWTPKWWRVLQVVLVVTGALTVAYMITWVI